jgi:hypothetical protein
VLFISNQGEQLKYFLLPPFWKNWRLGQGLGQTLGI